MERGSFLLQQTIVSASSYTTSANLFIEQIIIVISLSSGMKLRWLNESSTRVRATPNNMNTDPGVHVCMS